MPTALAHVPHWVPVLFLVLVAIGWRQSFERRVRPTAMATIALLMIGLSVQGLVQNFGASASALLAWLAGAAAVLLTGRRWVEPRGLWSEGAAVRLPGSWLPMALLLAVFAARVLIGALRGTGSPLMHEPVFVFVAASTLGALSGAFVARALAVDRFARRAAMARA